MEGLIFGILRYVIEFDAMTQNYFIKSKSGARLSLFPGSAPFYQPLG